MFVGSESLPSRIESANSCFPLSKNGILLFFYKFALVLSKLFSKNYISKKDCLENSDFYFSCFLNIKKYICQKQVSKFIVRYFLYYLTKIYFVRGFNVSDVYLLPGNILFLNYHLIESSGTLYYLYRYL